MYFFYLKSLKFLFFQNLAATDVDTDDSSLYFVITEAPLLGNIVVAKQKTNRFAQKDIFNKEV